MTIALERRYRFSASHLYRRPDWSEAENRARFGKCANLPGHGHNYRLYVTVGGEIDPQLIASVPSRGNCVPAAIRRKRHL